MKRWKVDRISVFLFIAVVSFLYDLTAYIGVRDTARFPHPFVYFRSFGDIEALRGFPGMLRQALFSLVAGGLIGWAVGLLILRKEWLMRATIRFLRIAMWFPFLVVLAVPYTFQLGIAAALLAAIYHYLSARSILAMPEHDAFPYIAGEVTLQAFFFSLISQIWVQRWNWMLNPMKTNAALAIIDFGLTISVVVAIVWIFKKSFLSGCEMIAMENNQQAHFSNGDFFDGVVLTSAWLLLWQLVCVALGYETFRPVPAMQKASGLLVSREVWYDVFVSLVEIGGGIVFGGLLSLALSTVMRGSKAIQRVIALFCRPRIYHRLFYGHLYLIFCSRSTPT